VSDFASEPTGDTARALTGPAELDPVALRGLSEHFDALLPHFGREALRCGGEVRVSLASDGSARALYLFHPVEKEASVFTHDAGLAESYRQLRPESAIYSDFPLGLHAVVLLVYSGTLGPAGAAHRYTHPARLAVPSDRGEIAAVLRSVDGPVDEQWIATAPVGVEDCLVVEGHGELAGVGWATRVGTLGRLHSLAVRPRYRRTRIGTDLFYARCDWLRRNGATAIVTEIAEENVGSRSIAESGGLHPVGRIYRSPPVVPTRP
jgi:GNAT superfamily N-acetyltransferase